MSSYAIPPVGTPVLVTLAHPHGDVDAPAPYRVTDVRDRQLTLQADGPCAEPRPPAGVPCLIATDDGGRAKTFEAVVVVAGTAMLIVDVSRDPRQHPRYRRPCRVNVTWEVLPSPSETRASASGGSMPSGSESRFRATTGCPSAGSARWRTQ